MGGIGEFIAAAARLLSAVAEVTIVTNGAYEGRYAELVANHDPRLPPENVRIAFVPEPTSEELEGWYNVVHWYSTRVLERLRELYPERGPDLIEFEDFLGEGFITVQAAEALDPFLQESCVGVRIQTTAEIAEVLNGRFPVDPARQVLYAMERYVLARADRVIWPFGDVLETYRRFYGVDGLAPDVRIPYPYVGPVASAEEERGYRAHSPLRFLYVGRLERRKGVHNLVRAARGLERDDFLLTLVGGDTPTAPLGMSMHEALKLAISDDPRIDLRGAADRAGVEEANRSHDVLVVPSLWECGPYTALEALHLNRPVLGTPVGGLAEIVAPGATGWLAAGTDSGSLARGLEHVLDHRDEVQTLIRSGELPERVGALCASRNIVERYQELATLAPRRRRTSARRTTSPPMVSAIVPYYRAARHVRQTLESLLAQTYRPLEIVLVNDGSFAEEDWILGELAAELPIVVVTQMNSGLGAARNFGISQSRGRYVLPFDADDLLHPAFVERCVSVLECHDDVAYVTSWSRYIEEDGTPRPGPLGYQPLGNSYLLEEENVAGSAEAVLRRRLFDLGFRYSTELTSAEDTNLYRELRRRGHRGIVIPERLLFYRVRADSMLRVIGLPGGSGLRTRSRRAPV